MRAGSHIVQVKSLSRLSRLTFICQQHQVISFSSFVAQWRVPSRPPVSLPEARLLVSSSQQRYATGAVMEFEGINMLSGEEGNMLFGALT